MRSGICLRNVRPTRLGLAGLVLAAGGAAQAMAAPLSLVPHRAVYELALKDASESAGIEDMVGRMVYEFSGSDCDGYTVSFRFVTEIDSGESTRLTDQQTTTFEDVRKHTFNFLTKSYVNQKLDHEVKGEASLTGKDLKVKLDQPEKQTLDLSGALFPTEHLIELIGKAEAGQNFYRSRIFDGSDEADESLLTTTVVGKKQKPVTTDPELKDATPLAGEDFWPVAISYFNEDAKQGDGTPVYSIAFKLYPNGVTRDLDMDYGDFALQGKLSNLEYLPSKATSCKDDAKG